MHTADLKYPLDLLDNMFPCDDEGQNVKASHTATAIAAVNLGVSPDEVQWSLPDVFSVRYGSSYVATARAGDKTVRFHSTEGDFQEGDDQV